MIISGWEREQALQRLCLQTVLKIRYYCSRLSSLLSALLSYKQRDTTEKDNVEESTVKLIGENCEFFWKIFNELNVNTRHETVIMVINLISPTVIGES